MLSIVKMSVSDMSDRTSTEQTVPASVPADDLIIMPGDDENFSEGGVDLTLIRYMLTLTPGERIEYLTRTIQSIERLRDAADSG